MKSDFAIYKEKIYKNDLSSVIKRVLLKMLDLSGFSIIMTADDIFYLVLDVFRYLICYKGKYVERINKLAASSSSDQPSSSAFLIHRRFLCLSHGF